MLFESNDLLWAGLFAKSSNWNLIHYNEERNHQGLDNQLIIWFEKPPDITKPIETTERLGGMLKSYRRAAWTNRSCPGNVSPITSANCQRTISLADARLTDEGWFSNCFPKFRPGLNIKLGPNFGSSIHFELSFSHLNHRMTFLTLRPRSATPT